MAKMLLERKLFFSSVRRYEILPVAPWSFGKWSASAMPALGINPFLNSKHLLSHSKTLISSQFQTSTGQYVEGVYFLILGAVVKNEFSECWELKGKEIIFSLNTSQLIIQWSWPLWRHGELEWLGSFWTIIALNDMVYKCFFCFFFKILAFAVAFNNGSALFIFSCSLG